MICLGLDDAEKTETIARYRAKHSDVRRVYILSPARFAPSFAAIKATEPTTQCAGIDGVFIDWPDLIRYRFYYRLLQEIGPDSLVVVNECLRTQDRNDLTYNCIRNYLRRTPHALVFQYMPVIDTVEDFMILYDFVSQSRHKRDRFSPELVREIPIHVHPVALEIHPVMHAASSATHALYAATRTQLLAEVRSDPDKDPHIIPRNLLLVSGKDKVPCVDPTLRYAGRNNRFKLPNLDTWRAVATPEPRVAFELPHNFIDLADALTVTRQRRLDVLVTDTNADTWYLRRFADWAGRMADVTATLHG